MENTSGIPKREGGKGVWNSECMGGGGEHFGISERIGGRGGKIPMPPVEGGTDIFWNYPFIFLGSEGKEEMAGCLICMPFILSFTRC